MDQVGFRRIGKPFRRDGRGDVRRVNLAAQVELGRQGAGFLVVGLLDGRDIDVLSIPIGSVLRIHAAFLRLELRQDVSAAVQHRVVAGRQTELISLFLQEFGIHRHVAGIIQHAQEEGKGLDGRVSDGLLVQRFDADGGKVHRLARVFAVGALVIGFRARQVIAQDPGVRRVVLGVQHVLSGGDKVIGGHVRIVFAGGSHPGDAVAELERPGQFVVRQGPALRQRRNDVAILVTLHQGVDNVGGNREFVRGSGRQIIQRSNLA